MVTASPWGVMATPEEMITLGGHWEGTANKKMRKFMILILIIACICIVGIIIWIIIAKMRKPTDIIKDAAKDAAMDAASSQIQPISQQTSTINPANMPYTIGTRLGKRITSWFW